MSNESYEVCIVGCGLAGSNLAYKLASDFDVCVVEKKPFDKLGCEPCGNAVHRSWFDGADVEPGPERYDSIESTAERVDLNLPDETFRADLSNGREGLVLNKGKFVKAMANDAFDRGAELIRGSASPEFDNGKVRGVNVDGRSIEAETYVDASGPASVLRSHFVQTSDEVYFRGYREMVIGDPGFDYWQIFQYDSDSAYWAFPLDGKLNLGGVAFREGPDLQSEINELKAELGLAGAEVEDFGFAPIVSLSPIELVHGNVVAIGDSGGTVNPVTGGGIGSSMKAANILSEVLVNGQELERMEERYMEEVASGYGKNYRLSRIFLRLQKYFWKRVAKLAFKKFYGGEKV